MSEAMRQLEAAADDLNTALAMFESRLCENYRVSASVQIGEGRVLRFSKRGADGWGLSISYYDEEPVPIRSTPLDARIAAAHAIGPLEEALDATARSVLDQTRVAAQHIRDVMGAPATPPRRRIVEAKPERGE